MSRSLRLVTVLVCATLAVSACGKRGALEPPPADDGTPATGHHKNKKSNPDAKTTKDKEGYVHAVPTNEAEHRPFVLDGLLR